MSKDGVSGDAVSSCKGGSSTGGGIQQSSQQKREDMRLTRMMLTIFLCFLVTFLPLMVVNVAGLITATLNSIFVGLSKYYPVPKP